MFDYFSFFSRCKKFLCLWMKGRPKTKSSFGVFSHIPLLSSSLSVILKLTDNVGSRVTISSMFAAIRTQGYTSSLKSAILIFERSQKIHDCWSAMVFESFNIIELSGLVNSVKTVRLSSACPQFLFSENLVA